MLVKMGLYGMAFLIPQISRLYVSQLIEEFQAKLNLK